MSTVALHPTITVRRRPASRAARPGTVRLTRRGRLVLTVVFLGLALAVFTVFGATSAATDDAGVPVPTRTVVVDEGDTLWAIAGEVAAPGEVRAMVDRIQELNALPGSSVYVGQRLAVPVAPTS